MRPTLYFFMVLLSRFCLVAVAPCHNLCPKLSKQKAQKGAKGRSGTTPTQLTPPDGTTRTQRLSQRPRTKIRKLKRSVCSHRKLFGRLVKCRENRRAVRRWVRQWICQNDRRLRCVLRINQHQRHARAIKSRQLLGNGGRIQRVVSDQC